jgi:hypothetical protein
MEAPKIETLPPPPSVISAIRAGFDTISTHLAVILLPLALDLFLWLGPRLNIGKILLPVSEMNQKLTEMPRVSTTTLEQVFTAYTEFAKNFNLFSFLSTFPIGISSLLRGLQPVDNPLGQPQIVPVPTIESILGWGILFTLVGWLGGALYYRWVASLALPQGEKVHLAAVGQSFSLSILYTILAFGVGIPVFIFIFLLYVVNPVIGQGLLLVLGFMSMWLVVPLYFAGHGIFMGSQDMFSSIFSGIRLARFTLPTSSLFVLCVLVINIGLNYLWSIPQSNSWMLLIGIFGHAFITTALLAASFIYYRDTTAWLQIIFDKLKAGAATPRA